MNVAGDALDLPFASASVSSISTLHVAEHIGLGRYGDALNPDGTRQTALELTRVLARDGTLLFAVPIGSPRVCFNAHRILDPTTVPALFPGLDLVEFSAVSDDGDFRNNVEPSNFRSSRYACGMYRFSKPATG
jgi:hypothetical protein